MHELSIAVSLVEAAGERAAEAGAERVSAVHLKLGTLSGVVRDALEFSFDIATDGTMLEGATLDIEEVPAVAFCPACEAEKQLSDVHPSFHAACPTCGTPTPELRQGRELEITAIRIEGPKVEG
jgi:hydrogenase nickel incorporation protein HypA/HybF